MNCENCGKELEDGAEAVAMTSGQISDSMAGFTPSMSEGWEPVLCPACAEIYYAAPQMAEKVARLEKAQGELLAALEQGLDEIMQGMDYDGPNAYPSTKYTVDKIRAAIAKAKPPIPPATTREPGASYSAGGMRLTFTFADKDGTAGKFTCAEHFGKGGGHAITCAEAERLLRTHGEALPFDIMAANYGDSDGFTGLTRDDLDTEAPLGSQLDTDWGPFEIWNVDLRTIQQAKAKPGALTQAVIVVTGNGGGLLRVLPLRLPTEVWEDGEAREWVDDHGAAGTIDSGEGYEIMSVQDARQLAAQLVEAAGGAEHKEDTCPVCGTQGLELDSEESDGEGGYGNAWDCPACGATGVQRREIVFIGHTEIVDPAGRKISEPPAIYRVHEYSEGRRFTGTLPQLDAIARREGATGPGFFSGQIDSRLRPGRKASIWNGSEQVADITRIK